MPRPPPREIKRNITGKLMDTAATATVPRRPTQNVSVSWYAVCRILAKIIGIDNEISDFRIGPSVNDFCGFIIYFD